MDVKQYIDFLNIVEKLKCNTRHSWTSNGRHESVAEHSWRTAIMALLVEDEFPDADITKVMKMCLIHDLGEAITGDIPSFLKTEQDELAEDKAVKSVLDCLPEPYSNSFKELFIEMNEKKSLEAKILKALDNMEAVVSHNEADISTWLPNEYKDNISYGEDNVKFSKWMSELKDELNKESLEKIEKSKS